MKLYYLPFSPVSQQVRLIAHELGKELELVALNPFAGETRQPEYLGLNPNGRLPTLVDGDFRLWESLAIIGYLAEGHALFPSGLKARALVNQWLFWKVNHLSPAVGKIFAERLLKPMMFKQPGDEALAALGVAELKEFGGTLNSHLGAHQYLANDALSVADFVVATTFTYRKEAGISLGDFPHVEAWLAKIESRPSWAATLPYLPKL